jgi:hypothetical protein
MVSFALVIRTLPGVERRGYRPLRTHEEKQAAKDCASEGKIFLTHSALSATLVVEISTYGTPQ